MNGLHIINVTSCVNKARLKFDGEWLKSIGFLPDMLVQFLPEPNGISFVLCDENIPKYSVLSQLTRAKSGMLLQVSLTRTTSGIHLSGAGLKHANLNPGDSLLARYEYGLIRARKLPKDSNSTARVVTSRLYGKWLAATGFVPSACFTAACEPGLITCRLQECDPVRVRERTLELVRFARANKLDLLQVQKDTPAHSHAPYIDMPPHCLDSAGFAPDEFLLAMYSEGLIKLQKLDFSALGF